MLVRSETFLQQFLLKYRDTLLFTYILVYLKVDAIKICFSLSLAIFAFALIVKYDYNLHNLRQDR